MRIGGFLPPCSFQLPMKVSASFELTNQRLPQGYSLAWRFHITLKKLSVHVHALCMFGLLSACGRLRAMWGLAFATLDGEDSLICYANKTF